MAAEALQVASICRHGIVVVTVHGVIDQTTVTQLRDALLAALAQRGPDTVLDLGGVDHIDAIGVDALRRTAVRVTVLGGHLHLARASPALTKTLRDSGLTRPSVGAVID